jgi:hypothetical protein
VLALVWRADPGLGGQTNTTIKLVEGSCCTAMFVYVLYLASGDLKVIQGRGIWVTHWVTSF